MIFAVLLAIVATLVFADIQAYLTAPDARERDRKIWRRWRERMEEEWSGQHWYRPEDFLVSQAAHYREGEDEDADFEPPSDPLLREPPGGPDKV